MYLQNRDSRKENADIDIREREREREEKHIYIHEAASSGPVSGDYGICSRDDDQSLSAYQTDRREKEEAVPSSRLFYPVKARQTDRLRWWSTHRHSPSYNQPFFAFSTLSLTRNRGQIDQKISASQADSSVTNIMIVWETTIGSFRSRDLEIFFFHFFTFLLPELGKSFSKTATFTGHSYGWELFYPTTISNN